MTYKESLEKFKETKLDLLKVMIADQVNGHGEMNFNNDEFEIICKYCEEYFNSSDVKLYELVDSVCNLIYYKEITIEQLNSYDWKEIDKKVEDELCYKF